MTRRKVILPNWANTEDASKSVEMLNEAFEGLTQGELVINTEANNTLLTTLNENGTPVIFESSEMIDKRLEDFLEKVHQHDNKDVLDSITSGRTDSWDKAESNAKTYTDQQIDFIVSGASIAFDTLKEVETWINNNHSGQAETMITNINAISGVAHSHNNKTVLDSITSGLTSQWSAAEPNQNAFSTISFVPEYESTIRISALTPSDNIDILLRDLDLEEKPDEYTGNAVVLRSKGIDINVTSGKTYIVGTTNKTSGYKNTLHASTTDIYMEGGEVYAASDERLKNFGDNVDVDFEKLLSIPKIYYTWKNDDQGKNMIGTSAQKLREVYPELVSENEDGKMAVSYEKLSIIALAAVDKLHKENEELKDRLKRIEEKLGL